MGKRETIEQMKQRGMTIRQIIDTLNGEKDKLVEKFKQNSKLAEKFKNKRK